MFLNVYEYKLYIYIYVCVLYIQFANLNLSALNQPRLPERLAPSRLILPYRERKIGFSFCLGQNVHTKSRLLPWSLGKRVWWSRPSRLPLRCAACWKLQYQRFQADTAQWLRHCQACELGSCFHRQVQQRVERQSQSFSGVAGQWARMDLMMCRFIALFQTTLTRMPNTSGWAPRQSFGSTEAEGIYDLPRDPWTWQMVQVVMSMRSWVEWFRCAESRVFRN